MLLGYRTKYSIIKRFVTSVFRNELSVGLIALAIFVILFLTSCAGNNVQADAIATQYAVSLKSDKLNTEIAQKTLEYRQTFTIADYKIGPEDLLEIEVFQVPDLKTLARVSAKGYIKLPLIEGIQAGGLTVSELESLLAERLKKYVKEPVVSVFVKELRSQQISILGSVKEPRVYYVTGQKYLLDMLSLAGGVTQDAGSVCIIQRVSGKTSPDSGREYIERIVIDLDELLIKGKAELNIAVTSGDTIHVPQNGIFFVDGGVQTPGAFPLKGKTTLTQAISLAKGMTYEAISSDIKIYRDNGTPEREVINVSYDSILERKEPDFEIRDKDVIIVGKSGFKAFIKGLAAGLNFGAFSLGKGF
jgi:polysaccharide export outer membrane protein